MRYRMNFYGKYLCFSLVVLMFASCNSWLDVEPKSQVKDKDLYSSESGFKEALAGVYSIMTQEYLYGKELTFGMLGVLAQEWDYEPSEYADDKLYKYESTKPEVRIDSIWCGLYNAIANANKLLEEIDAKQSKFTGVNYEVIKGEALALRAYLHFDLLRVFGASYAEKPDKMAIPYVTAYTSDVFPQRTVTEVIGKVLEDLTTASEYLKNDPMYTGKAVTETDDNGYLLNRQVHLNYYAVKGLMARVYLYKKDYTNAARCASEVVESGKFEWVEQANLTNENMADVSFSTEHLFALNVVTLGNRAEKYFSGSSSFFAMDEATLLDYYGSAQDYRYLYQFKSGTGLSSTMRYIKKYDQLEGDGTTAWPASYRNKMPLIRLSEMYYILAECRHYTSGDALGALNEVRRHRGVADLGESDVADFGATLLAEFRKEVVGEGQLFFYYKRVNAESVKRTDADMVGMGLYKLPLPKTELQNPGWVSNK